MKINDLKLVLSENDSRKVKEYCERQNINIRQFAKQLGVSHQTLYTILNGKQSLGLTLYKKLSAYVELEITIKEIR